MRYKNCGNLVKTFFGITIKPGQTKDFPGFVSSQDMIRVYETDIDNKPKRGRPKKSEKADSPSINSDKPSIDNTSKDDEKEQTTNSKEKVADGKDNN